jgi:hypothetical protein
MAKQTGMMTHKWTQETENIFDVPLDTDGLSTFIPELKTTFETTRKVDIKASIGPKMSQPLLEQALVALMLPINGELLSKSMKLMNH